jgi:hypothetical protein
MHTVTRDELYGGLVRLCQTFGTTTEATYDLIDSVIDSIGNDEPCSSSPDGDEPHKFTDDPFCDECGASR